MTVNNEFGFAPEHDAPIPYMQRIRDYYLGLGYGAPYRWAHYAEVPFAAACKSRCAESRIGLITTAAPYQPGRGDQGPGAAYNGAAKFYTVYSGDSAPDHDLRISHIAYDRDHTTAEDQNTWFPLPAIAAARRRRADRRGGAALSRRPDQPQPPRDARAGLPGAAARGCRATGSTRSSSSPFDRCVTRP